MKSGAVQVLKTSWTGLGAHADDDEDDDFFGGVDISNATVTAMGVEGPLAASPGDGTGDVGTAAATSEAVFEECKGLKTAGEVNVDEEVGDAKSLISAVLLCFFSQGDGRQDVVENAR